MQDATEEVLWTPSPERCRSTQLARYMDWLVRTRGLRFGSYNELWQWSVSDLEGFWRSIWDFGNVQASGDPGTVLVSREMPGARWFPDVRLNYAEHALHHSDDDRCAILARSESRPERRVSWRELKAQVASVAAALRELGVAPGDRVASFMPSTPETVVAFLACASIGAVWSSASPDMGAGVVVDRFRQIEPKVLLAVDGYRYNGKAFDRTEVVARIRRELSSLRHVVFVAGLDATQAPADWGSVIDWSDLVGHSVPLAFERVPFDHPLWVVYSSGTTGPPKAIVHGHGGMVLEQLKTVLLHNDLHAGEHFMFLGSTGWIVWNLLVSGLLAGATIVLFDGSPSWPDPTVVWRFLAEHRVEHFGCGAAFITGAMKAGMRPTEHGGFERLKSISSTGSPLPVEGYRWVYDAVKRDLWLASISGGTDIASGFVVGAPTLPVVAGELQCKALGVAVHAFDEAGNAVVGEVGELVVTEPMPSMPLHFWNDPGNARYRDSYFTQYPGKWRHGDWIRFTERGTAVIYGRSDATINRYGIRMGTAEIYRAVEDLPEVLDSMVVDLEYLGKPSALLLFVVLREGVSLDEGLRGHISHAIRTRASSRHVPDEIYAVAEIPRTLTGKKMELPVRKLMLGASPEKVASPDSMVNPGSLDYFSALARERNR